MSSVDDFTKELLSNPSTGTLDDLSKFAYDSSIADLLKEYLDRVVTSKPDDPVSFLIKQIEETPFVPEQPPAKTE